MGVSASTSRVQYSCNGLLQDFPFLFGVQLTSDIQVVLTDSNDLETILTETTDYVVSAVNSDYESGGTVTTVATYAAGNTITIIRNVPVTQGSDFTEGMPTLYESFENGLDKLTMIAQQIEEKIARQMTVPVSEASTVSRELPSAATRAGKFLGFDEDGEPVAITEIEGVSISTFGQALLTSNDAAEGRAAMDVYSDTETDTAISDAVAAIPESSGLLEFVNLGIAASVGSKALTVSLKGRDGNDPSASNIVTIPFRSATITSGTVVRREITSPLSVVLSSGSTLGFTAALAGRIYVWAIDNAGTVVLGLSRTADIFPEDKLVSTTAEGGAGAADSASVMYSTAAQTDKACRCIGYIEIVTGGTPGEWDNAPTKTQVMGPGVKRTGDIVQKTYTQTGAYASGTGLIPFDNTIPQISEGNEFMTLAIVPTSAINKLIITVVANLANSAINYVCLALFQDATADALAAQQTMTSTVDAEIMEMLRHHMVAGTTSSTTFKVRAGGYWASTTYFNGDGITGAKYGGVLASSITIEEVMV